MTSQELDDYLAKRQQLLHMKSELLSSFDDAVLHENWEQAARYQNRAHQVERALDRLNTAAFNEFLQEPVVIVTADVDGEPTNAFHPLVETPNEILTPEELAAGAPQQENTLIETH
jgi:hypothetical protein